MRRMIRKYVLGGAFERHFEAAETIGGYIIVGVIIAAAILFAPIIFSIFWR